MKNTYTIITGKVPSVGKTISGEVICHDAVGNISLSPAKTSAAENVQLIAKSKNIGFGKQAIYKVRTFNSVYTVIVS